MDIRIIKSPSGGTLDILKGRMKYEETDKIEYVGAVGLVQGKLIEMICASDVAEKAAGVTVKDIRGSCPQNMILLAIFGDIAAVEDAVDKIKEENSKTNGEVR